jgi:hypothetical protein
MKKNDMKKFLLGRNFFIDYISINGYNIIDHKGLKKMSLKINVKPSKIKKYINFFLKQ